MMNGPGLEHVLRSDQEIPRPAADRAPDLDMPLDHLKDLVRRMDETESHYKLARAAGVFTSYSMLDSYRAVVRELLQRKRTQPIKARHVEPPSVAAGQLRCQRCARDVVGRERFCAACISAHAARPKKLTEYVRKTARVYRPAIYKPKVCARDGCKTTFAPRGPRSLYCEAHRVASDTDMETAHG